MSNTWRFFSAGQIVFGNNAAARTGEVAARLGIKRALIVTDGYMTKHGLLDAVKQPLAAAGVMAEVFDGGEPEPSLAAADACVSHGRAHHVDGVIGLGGGSNMDLAKAAATVLAHGGTLTDFVGDDQVPGPVLPLICLPTTAGTGSEVTFAAVLTDTENELKVPILSNYIRPSAAIVDPELTLTCPAKVTADSGIDALTHAIEAFTAISHDKFPLPSGEASVYQGNHPLTDCLARQAIELIGRNLATVVAEPDNRAAREAMSLAATTAGLAFSNSGVALVHALQAAVGGATHSAHGAGNGLLLPHVMRFNLPSCLERTAEIARLLGCDTEGMDMKHQAELAVETVQSLSRTIGIPQRLTELGMSEQQVPAVASKAFLAQRILRVNPRSVSEDEIRALLEAAL